MTEETRVPAGTKDDPLLVWQGHFKTCHHTILSPQPTKGQFYRVTGFLDFGGRCPACEEERAVAKAQKGCS